MNIDTVWVVALLERCGYFTFSSAEKAFTFMYNMAKEIYKDDPDLVLNTRIALDDDFHTYGIKGGTFGVEDFGFAEPTTIDEEI